MASREIPIEIHRRVCRLDGYIWIVALLWIVTGVALLLEADAGRAYTRHHEHQKVERVAVLTSPPIPPTVQPKTIEDRTTRLGKTETPSADLTGNKRTKSDGING